MMGHSHGHWLMLIKRLEDDVNCGKIGMTVVEPGAEGNFLQGWDQGAEEDSSWRHILGPRSSFLESHNHM